MTNREKIILGLTTVAAIGGALYYAVASPMSNPGAPGVGTEPTDYTALITRVHVSVTQGELKEREEHVLTAASTQWLRNPLRSRPLISSGGALGIPLPKYTGFINTGPQPIAIIDGRDYRPGDAVQGGEFRVARIYSDRIELLRQGASDPVRVLLEQPQALGGSR